MRSPDERNPAVRRGFEFQQATGQVGANGNASAFQTSTPPRRCPWYDDVIRRSAGKAWHATAFLHAGTGAWERATASREHCIRACTLLPPGTDPATVRWPSIRYWIGDTGDLPTTIAIELARCLIDAGSELVQLVGDHLKPSLTMRRARHAV